LKYFSTIQSDCHLSGERMKSSNRTSFGRRCSTDSGWVSPTVFCQPFIRVVSRATSAAWAGSSARFCISCGSAARPKQ
jgi:hypothetical protein